MAKFNAVCPSPSCRHKFPWDPTKGPPRACPQCGYQTEDTGEVVIAAPFIGSARTKATDNCYRQLEQSSQVRAELAAQMAGVPVSEMSHLKVTNIRDTKEGEVAAIPVANPVTQQMDLMRACGMPVGYGGAENAGIGDSTGRQGLRAMEAIQGRFLR